MDNDRQTAPAFWAEELARGDHDIARGNVVPAHVVHNILRQAIEELEAEMADGSERTTMTPPGR